MEMSRIRQVLDCASPLALSGANSSPQAPAKAQGDATPPPQGKSLASEEDPGLPPVGRIRFFQRVDWIAFGITSLLGLIVYLLTLPPEVGLSDSGMFSTTAMYAGVPDAPGFPIWVCYSWLFTKLPVANIGWRVALASAVAAAVASGIVSLIVSRSGTLLLEGFTFWDSFSTRKQEAIRIVCACVAGLGFALDCCVWSKADTADPWPLGLLLFSFVLCLLTRWIFVPQFRRGFYLASLVYGLSVCNDQVLIVALPGLLCVVAIGHAGLGRDLIFAGAVALWIALALHWWLPSFVPYLFDPYLNSSTVPIFLAVAIFAALASAVMTIWTRRFLTEWKAVIGTALLVLTGLGAYLLLPVFSMTNPPMNWAYPRVFEGFIHLVTRGQYERPWFNHDPARFVMQIGIFWKIIRKDFGLVYLAPAVIPLLVFWKATPAARRWTAGTLAIFVSLSVLLLIGLNVSPDERSVELVEPMFAAAHLPLAMFAGCGLVAAAAFLSRPGHRT